MILLLGFKSAGRCFGLFIGRRATMMMTIILFVGYALLAFAAIAFAVWVLYLFLQLLSLLYERVLGIPTPEPIVGLAVSLNKVLSFMVRPSGSSSTSNSDIYFDNSSDCND